MTILVGVTINFALNGGIITKSKQAAKDMQKAADREQLQMAVIASMDYTTGEVNGEELSTNLPNWDVSNSAPYACVSPSGNVFTVAADGTITEAGESSGNSGSSNSGSSSSSPSNPTELSDLERYILGANGTGRSLFIEQDATDGIMSMQTISFMQDQTNTNSTVYQNVKFGYGLDEDNFNETLREGYIYIRYEKEVYKVTVRIDPGPTDSDSDDIYLTSALEKTYTPTGHIGEYVTYGGNDYIVMAEDTINGTVDLISANTLQVNSNDIYLGYNDPGAITAVPAVDEQNPTDAEKAERGRWSYNNMVNTLVTACKDATSLTVDGTDVISIRSVGNTNVKYTSNGITGSDNSGTYTYNWENLGAEINWYNSYGFNSYNMKDEDTNYLTDVNTMKQLGIITPDDMEYYWLASRNIYDNNNDVYFRVHVIQIAGTLDAYTLCFLYSSGETRGNDYSFAIRPIVTVSSSVLGF